MSLSKLQDANGRSAVEQLTWWSGAALREVALDMVTGGSLRRAIPAFEEIGADFAEFLFGGGMASASSRAARSALLEAVQSDGRAARRAPLEDASEATDRDEEDSVEFPLSPALGLASLPLVSGGWVTTTPGLVLCGFGALSTSKVLVVVLAGSLSAMAFRILFRDSEDEHNNRTRSGALVLLATGCMHTAFAVYGTTFPSVPGITWQHPMLVLPILSRCVTTPFLIWVLFGKANVSVQDVLPAMCLSIVQGVASAGIMASNPLGVVSLVISGVTLTMLISSSQDVGRTCSRIDVRKRAMVTVDLLFAGQVAYMLFEGLGMAGWISDEKIMLSLALTDVVNNSSIVHISTKKMLDGDNSPSLQEPHAEPMDNAR